MATFVPKDVNSSRTLCCNIENESDQLLECFASIKLREESGDISVLDDLENVVDSLAALNITDTRTKLKVAIESWFLQLVKTGNHRLESGIVAAISYLRQTTDGQAIGTAYEEFLALTDPSSDSDNLEDDPNYEPDEDGHGDNSAAGADDEDDEEEEEDEDGDDEEEEEDDDEDDEDESYVRDEAEERAEDAKEEVYNQELADLPPLPLGTIRNGGVTFVEDLQVLPLLKPDVHILGFHPNLSIVEKISLWRRGKRSCFDFEPSKTLRYVWRLDLLLRGKNPSRRKYAMREPPVDEAGAYDVEGWTTDEDTQGDGVDSEDEMDWSDDDERRRRRSRRKRMKEADTMHWSD